MMRASYLRRTPLLALAAALVALAVFFAPVDAPAAQAQGSCGPTNLQATVIAGGVQLSWRAPGDCSSPGSVTGYEVLRRKSGQSSLTSYVYDTGSTDTSYTDYRAAEQGETYTYQVKAWRGGFGNSLASNAAQATIPGTCPISGSEAVNMPVSAVPIVVMSTTADYFVLYVLQELNGVTVELPVAVTRGEAGTTILRDNLDLLPAEKYRVKKYQVANPADVDGDCIDDITELEDLGTKNPVNPAEAVDIGIGAVVIPNRETFETLSYQGDWDARNSHLNNLQIVQFYIFHPNTARPAVYFMNTVNHRYHRAFRDELYAAVGSTAYPDNTGMGGTIVYHPNVVAPDGSLGVYRYQFQPYLGLSFEKVAYAHEVLAASMPFLENNLAYYPMPDFALPRYHREKALYDASRVNVLLDEDLPDVDFISLNWGEGYGFLRKMTLEERPNPRDVVIYEALPNDLPRVAGIITTVPQTPLSHVNLRAVQDDVPNAFIRDALDDSDIDDLIGRHVHYTVTQSGYTLRAATKTEVDAHYEASRPAQAQTPERDLSVIGIAALSDVGFDDWDAFGVKAANVAVLGTLNFPQGTVPDGFAVPFHFYDQFMKNAVLSEETLFGKKKWADADKFTLPAGTKLSAVVTAMLAHARFQTDYEVQDEMLDDLRDAIKDAASPQWIIDALTTMHATYPVGQSLRYRSSTNNEDLPGYSGAGLYDSKTQDPDETQEDGIDKSIKGVWASLWNFRAFVERDFHRIDHTKTAMGVLVHPNYTGELANGVAVSFDPFSGREGAYYVNTQVGEDLVTNPEAHSVPEEILLLADGSYEVLVYSNLRDAREPLMSDAQMKQLRGHLAVIHERFAALYNPPPGQPFAMEIEFKITSANKLAIKQARPWVFAEAPEPPEGTAPWNIRVEPGDGALTVAWSVNPREGMDVGEIRHALRWSQTTGADHYWANPRDPRSVGPNDGITVAGGVTSYVITGLENGVATRVDLRSFTGGDRSESSAKSSRWVTEEGEHTTPRGGEQPQQQSPAAMTYSVTAAASAPEGGNASLTITLSQAAPEGGVEFSVAAGYSGNATATADDVGAVTSPVVVAQGNTALDIAIPTAADAVDEDDETFTVTVAANTAGWERAGDGRDTATVTIVDDDTAGVTVNAANPLAVAEGGSATYTVVLDSRPTTNVTVSASSGDGGAATVSPASHTFTPSAWNTPLTFTVSGVADDDPNDERVAVSHGVASDDARYAALLLPTVAVAVSDTTADAPQGGQSPQEKYADLIARVKEWRDDPCCAHNKQHTDRWDRVLLTFGETVADTTLAIMTAAEAQTYADRGWTRWIEVTKALRELENRAPTVDNAIADATIVNESGTHQVSLSGVFSDADNDALTITAVSSNQAVATALAAPDHSTVTVNAHARGTATVTVTADDGTGGTASDEFTVKVKAAPVVAQALADISSGLEEGATQDVSPSGVFSDADNDALTITATSGDEAMATVSVAADYSALTISGVAEGTATITVTAQDSDGNTVSDAFDVSVSTQQQETPNRAPTVAGAIADATIVNESGTHQVSLSGVFDDADGDGLTVTATSSDEAVATVSVASDYSSLTVTAKSRGKATITVTAKDGKGGTVSDAFDVTVKAAPVVARPLADVSGLEVDATQNVSLSGVFSDADGDALTITVASSDEDVAAAYEFDGALTLAGVAAGSATITVTAQDADGNRVSDTFDVSVVEAEAKGEGPTPVLNLRCIAQTDRVAFLWDAPEWSGGDLYAYDYRLTLPAGRSEAGRYTGTVLYRPGSYQSGARTSVSVKAVYETADGSEVSSAEATLTCRIGG